MLSSVRETPNCSTTAVVFHLTRSDVNASIINYVNVAEHVLLP